MIPRVFCSFLGVKSCTWNNGQWAMGNGQKNITIKKVFGDKEPKDLSLEECKKAVAGT
jgi:hypothetical protein